MMITTMTIIQCTITTMHDFRLQKYYEQFISLFSMNIVSSCDYKTIWVLLRKGRIVDGGCVRKEKGADQEHFLAARVHSL